MIKQSYNRLAAVLAMALLLVAPAAALASEEGAEGAAEETLVGQLTTDEVGVYLLVEQESGDEVRLKSAVELKEHVGSTIEVTGQWATDADGEYFEVWSVTPMSEEEEPSS